MHHSDCLDVLPTLPDASVDAIIADPPYGTTACKWDSVIPFGPMWRELRRVIKPNGAIVLFGSEPFSSALRMSNIREYKYDWVWEKNKATGHLNANRMPLNSYEMISVFYERTPVYNPQYGKGAAYNNRHKAGDSGECYGVVKESERRGVTTRHPRRNIQFDVDIKAEHHPTQKPVALLEYLIRTYTNEGETVLDFTMGSGTTGIAAINTGREFIGIELDEGYYNIARERIAAAQAQPLQQELI